MTWTVWVSHDKVRKAAWSRLLDGLTETEAVAQTETRRSRTSPDVVRFQALPESETP